MKKILLILTLISTNLHAESPYTQPDKVGHYATGATIAAVGSIFANPEVGLAAAIAAAGAKEWYDYKNPDKGNFEKADFWATTLGGVLVYAALKTEKFRVTYVNNTPVLNYTYALK